MIELNLSETLLARLETESKRRNLPIPDLIYEALTSYLEDDEPTKEEILANLRQGMLDALRGNVRPAHEVLDEIEADYADKS